MLLRVILGWLVVTFTMRLFYFFGVLTVSASIVLTIGDAEEEVITVLPWATDKYIDTQTESILRSNNNTKLNLGDMNIQDRNQHESLDQKTAMGYDVTPFVVYPDSVSRDVRQSMAENGGGEMRRVQIDGIGRGNHEKSEDSLKPMPMMGSHLKLADKIYKVPVVRNTRNILNRTPEMADSGPNYAVRKSKRGETVVSEEVTFDTLPQNTAIYVGDNEDSQLKSGYKYQTSKNHAENPADTAVAGHYLRTPAEVHLGELPMRNLTRIHLPQRPRLLIGKNSCKQYLEFLRYAFEQLDAKDLRSDDYYYYYDDEEYRQPLETKMSSNANPLKPLTVLPDLNIFRNLAYPNDLASESQTMDAVNETQSNVPATLPESQRSTPPEVVTIPSGVHTVEPLTIKEADQSTESTNVVTLTNVTSQVEPAHEVPNQISSTEAFLVGASVNGPLKQPEDDGKGSSEDCHDRLFPCPDNLNLTYPVNGYCNRFVICNRGKPRPEFCQEGLHFNLITRQCDLPHNSFCSYSCPAANGYFGIPGDCEGFFKCSNWYPEYRMCPPRMHWDFKAKICAFEDLSSCPLKCEADYLLKPYNGDCSSYVICNMGIPTYHKCPIGTHFDGAMHKCIPVSQSKCVDDGDYITRNRGIQNGKKKLCAKLELKVGTSDWCQETEYDRK